MNSSSTRMNTGQFYHIESANLFVFRIKKEQTCNVDNNSPVNKAPINDSNNMGSVYSPNSAKYNKALR